MKNSIVASLLVIAILGTAGIEYLVLSPLVSNPTVGLPTQARPFYQSSNVSIAVGCCPSLPTDFVVGNPNANYYGFEVNYGPLTYGHGSTITVVSGELMAIRVYQENMLPVRYQWANFTIGGTFSPYSLNRQNATLLDGDVMMNWVVVSSILYLHIITK
jgi:hypothetical protein